MFYTVNQHVKKNGKAVKYIENRRGDMKQNVISYIYKTTELTKRNKSPVIKMYKLKERIRL